MSKPSAILMGSKPGSVVALSMMLERGWEVPYVVVSSGVDHEWITGETLQQAAIRLNIPVRQQSDLDHDTEIDFIISYMYRHRVKPATLAMAQRAAINFHPAPLPEFAGWAFYNVAILENAREYGCTCHYMDEGFDSGPLLKVRRFPIDAEHETAVSLERQTQREMISLFAEFCDLAESGDSLPRQTQDRQRWRYLTRGQFDALKEIPFSADQQTIQRYARAFWYPPYPCAFMRVNHHTVEIIPDLGKRDLAEALHAHDLADLQNHARTIPELQRA